MYIVWWPVTRINLFDTSSINNEALVFYKELLKERKKCLMLKASFLASIKLVFWKWMSTHLDPFSVTTPKREWIGWVCVNVCVSVVVTHHSVIERINTINQPYRNGNQSLKSWEGNMFLLSVQTTASGVLGETVLAGLPSV